jgi:Clp amino terminal domain, pathogenicity island component
MRGPTALWGESPQLPREVVARVTRHARELGRHVAGDDLFLLAVCELPGDPPARRALEEEDVDAAHVLPRVQTSGDARPDNAIGVTFSPATYLMHGRAQGFAAVLGDGVITPEHVLLALVWDPVSASSTLLWQLGVDRGRVVDRLAALHVPVPKASLPSHREVTWGERVWFGREDVSAVLEHLRLNISPGAPWGFNYEGKQAWAAAEAGVDVERLVKEATGN